MMVGEGCSLPQTFWRNAMAIRAPNIFDKIKFPSYVFREYPKMLYGPGGVTIVVLSPAEEAALVGEWWTTPAEAKVSS